MADKKISALTASTTPLAGTEVLPIVQGGSTVKVAVSDLTAGRAVSASSVTSTGNSTFNTAANVGWTVGARSDNAISAIYPTAVTPSSTNYAVQASSTITYLNSPGATSLAVSDNAIATATATALTLPNANLVIGTAGKGIDFSANTHAAGMTSELLNWYEEGTWTATISDGTTDAVMNAGRQTGTYTRVGRQVTVHMYVATTSMTGVTGNLRIKGLPFTVGNSPTVGGAIGYCDQMTFIAGQVMVLQTASGVDYIVLRYWNGGTTPNMTGAQWGAVGEIGFTLTYFV
jgi:hypothetical protein